MTIPMMILSQNLNTSEEEVLKEVARSGQSVEFFSVTNIPSVFPNIDCLSEAQLPAAQAAIDAVLASYGIDFSPWEKIGEPSQDADADGSRRYRYSNGVIHFGVYDCSNVN